MNNLLRYRKLNSSFEKEYIFHIGAEAGFYSEFCNMVSAILYCLQHHYKFILYSKDANFGFDNGWRDYFLPFCDETTFFIHKKYNYRKIQTASNPKKNLLVKLYKYFNKNTMFTYDLWDEYFCKKFDEVYFDIPELQINGNLQQASAIIVDMIYRFNENTLKNIEEYPIQFDKYLSMQIRRGDKITECSLPPIQRYFEEAQKNNIKQVFMLTDDYKVIEDIRVLYSEWEIISFVNQNEKGYYHKEFESLNKEEKRKNLIKLFASVELIRRSDLFIGTYTTNVGLFLGMAMPREKIKSIQKIKWNRFDNKDVLQELVSN